MISFELQSLLPRVRALYEKPPRAYHNWSHITHCLAEFEMARHLCEDPLAVELTIWFHDCVYDPHRHDNEERSADVAAQLLGGAGVDAAAIARVRSLVLDTRHSGPPTSPDGEYMVDIDLAILGQAAERFNEYEFAIRQEYAHVPDQDFAAGRTAILQRFLGATQIFHTELFRNKYDRQARLNLSRSIERLSPSA